MKAQSGRSLHCGNRPGLSFNRSLQASSTAELVVLSLPSSSTSIPGSPFFSFFCLDAIFVLFPFFPFIFLAGTIFSSDVLTSSGSFTLLFDVSPSGARPLVGVKGRGVEAARSDSSWISAARARVTRGMAVGKVKDAAIADEVC